MYHLCTTATYPAIYHKRKILDIWLNIKDFPSVGVTGFEPATTRPPEIMGIDDVIRLTGYSKATIYKFTHQRLIPFHKPAHGGRRLVFIRQEIEDWMKENSIPTVGQYCKEQFKKINN